MSKIIVGNAPDSWGVWFANDPKQVSWSRFLDEVAAALNAARDANGPARIIVIPSSGA